MREKAMTNSWTVQSAEAWADVLRQPGQVLREDQLPDPEVQRKAGIDPDAWLHTAGASLFVEGQGSHGLNADRTLADVASDDEARQNVAAPKGRTTRKASA